MELISTQCSNNHTVRQRCHEAARPCPTCKRDQAMQQARQAKQDAYLHKMIALEDQIIKQCEEIKDLEDEQARTESLRRKTEELERTTRSARIKKETHQNSKFASKPDVSKQSTKVMPSVASRKSSKAVQMWEKQKETSQTENEHIDAIMEMIGLESVKLQVLKVKNKVDISLLQGASIERVRFNAIFLGNPGTGESAFHGMMIADVLSR